MAPNLFESAMSMVPRARVIDGALRRIRPRHADADDIFWAYGIGGDDGGECRVDATAESDDGLLEAAFVHVVARAQHQGGIDTGHIARDLVVHVTGERL